METFDIVCWVTGIGCGLVSTLFVALNLCILGLSLQGKQAPSYCPVIGFVFGVAALVLIPMCLHPMGYGGVLLMLCVSESAGVFRR